MKSILVALPRSARTNLKLAEQWKSSFINPRLNSRFCTTSSVSVKPKLRLLTKRNCTLCEDAKQELWSIPGIKERLDLVEVNILAEGNEDLFDLYRYEIPVFFLDRKFVSKNRLDQEKLLKILNEQ